MALALNEEQRYLKETSRSFFRENSPIEDLRKLRDSRDEAGYSTTLWKQMVELGWTGVIFPDSVGGLDFGFMGLGAIMEEAGRTLAASPLLSSVVTCGSAIMLGGSQSQKQELLPGILSGDTLYALALEEKSQHAPLATSMSAPKVDDAYRLTGKKIFVLDGHIADQLIVVARTSGNAGDRTGLTLFLVDAKSTGITCNRTIMADSRNAANIHFDNVEVSSSTILGEVDQGYALLEKILDRANICIAAEMLGGIQEIFERTVQYLKEREQFGAPIGSFQALQHRAATMFVEIELAKSTVAAALSALDNQPEQASQLASLSKSIVSETYELVSNEAVQLHGGIGVTDELDIGLFLKRSRVAQQTFGNPDFHRNRYAELRDY